MSTKSGLAVDKRWQEAFRRSNALMEAMKRVTVYSAEWYDLRDQLDDNNKIISSCNVATREAFSLNHTTEGDFTHLAAVGSVSFYRGAYA